MLNGEIFTNLKEAQILTERRRCEYNEFRPHLALNYEPPTDMYSGRDINIFLDGEISFLILLVYGIIVLHCNDKQKKTFEPYQLVKTSK